MGSLGGIAVESRIYMHEDSQCLRRIQALTEHCNQEITSIMDGSQLFHPVYHVGHYSFCELDRSAVRLCG